MTTPCMQQAADGCLVSAGVFAAPAYWDFPCQLLLKVALCCCIVAPSQELYKQVAWPLYKGYGHAFEAFKNMVQDDGEAMFKKLEEDRGPLTVLTPQVRDPPALFFDPFSHLLTQQQQRASLCRSAAQPDAP